MKAADKFRLLPDIVKKYADSMQLKLPVFPGAAFELRQLLTSDDASIDQIAKVISKDQAIASHVLKLANSSYYSGTGGKITTIKDAILRLGSNHIFNLVICSCQHTYYRSQNSTLAKHLQILWQHALCVSIGSKWLVNELGFRKLGEEAFLAGLLHDIGKLLIVKTIESVNFSDNDLDKNNQIILHTIDELHTEQGYKLLTSWSIPRVYCQIALNHHSHVLDTSDTLLLAIRLSDHVCKKIGLSMSQDDNIDLLSLTEVQSLSVDESVLSELETVMLDVVQSEYSMLNEMRLDSSTPYGIYI